MSRYPLYQFSEFEYYFEVEELVETQYKVSFSSSSHLLPMDLIDCDIYEVSFNRIGEKKGQKPDVGQRIMETISFAMTRFIEKYNCPIIFICDSLDNKHLGRMRRFNTWYNKLENKALFTFEAKELYSIEEEFTYYTGMVIQNNHPKLIELIIEFDNPEIFKQKI